MDTLQKRTAFVRKHRYMPNKCVHTCRVAVGFESCLQFKDNACGGRNGLVAAYLNWLGRQEQAEGYLSKRLTMRHREWVSSSGGDWNYTLFGRTPDVAGFDNASGTERSGDTRRSPRTLGLPTSHSHHSCGAASCK